MHSKTISGDTHKKKQAWGPVIKEGLVSAKSPAVVQSGHFKLLHHRCDTGPGGGVSGFEPQPGNTDKAASRGRPTASGALSMQEVVSGRASDF